MFGLSDPFQVDDEGRNWMTDLSESPYLENGMPGLTEHPWCNDPDCSLCSDEAWYRGQEALEEERRERRGR